MTLDIRINAVEGRNGWRDGLTTAWTFSMIARLAASMAPRDPTRPISRSISRPLGCETLILQPVVCCMSLIVSPPIVICQS